MPGDVMAEHAARYERAREFARGKRVLDVACGSGYGADWLAPVAASVVGGDIDAETIAACQRDYNVPNLRFEVMDARSLPFPARSFDLVVSFETLEHMAEGERFLAEAARVLADDGTLLMSVPFGGPAGNPYHLAYYQRPMFEPYLRNFFGEVTLEYQRGAQFYEESTSPDYCPVFSGEYGLATCKRPLRREHRLVSIVVLTHDGLEHTKRCLGSIERHTLERYELILVDNGSTDGTPSYLRGYGEGHRADGDSALQRVVLVLNSDNRGFAVGNNQGIAASRGEYVLLLNNDVIVTNGWLERLLAVFERHPGVGLVGPMTNYVSGPQLVERVPYADVRELDEFAAQWGQGRARESQAASRLVGFCLLARRAVFDRVGGLDPRFGLGNYEDDDLCVRAAMAGFEARIARDVFVHHVGGAVFAQAGIDVSASLDQNWETFKRKWKLPEDTSRDNGYRLRLDGRDVSRYYVPLT